MAPARSTGRSSMASDSVPSARTRDRPVQIDLAVAEGKGRASRTERHRLHVQHAGVELHGRIKVGNDRDQMVEAIDAHGAHRAIPISWRTLFSARASTKNEDWYATAAWASRATASGHGCPSPMPGSARHTASAGLGIIV